MKNKTKKNIVLIQRIVDAALKRKLYLIAAFAESFPVLLVAVLAIVSVFNLPLAHLELMFWLRSILSVVAFILWAIFCYEAYKNMRKVHTTRVRRTP